MGHPHQTLMKCRAKVLIALSKQISDLKSKKAGPVPAFFHAGLFEPSHSSKEQRPYLAIKELVNPDVKKLRKIIGVLIKSAMRPL